MAYDKVSVLPFIWVREMDKSESGQMLLEKVKWTFFDAYLWQTMWNHAKKSMEGSILSDSVVFKVLHFWWRLCTAIFLYTETMKDTEFSRLRSHLKPSWKFVGFSDYQRQVSWEKPFCNLTSLHPRLRDQLVCEAGFEAPSQNIIFGSCLPASYLKRARWQSKQSATG